MIPRRTIRQLEGLQRCLCSWHPTLNQTRHIHDIRHRPNGLLDVLPTCGRPTNIPLRACQKTTIRCQSAATASISENSPITSPPPLPDVDASTQHKVTQPSPGTKTQPGPSISFGDSWTQRDLTGYLSRPKNDKPRSSTRSTTTLADILKMFPRPESISNPPETSYNNTEYTNMVRFMSTLADANQTAAVFLLAKEMASRGYAPTLDVFNILIGTCANMENLPYLEEVALSLHKEMRAEKIAPTAHTYRDILKILSQTDNDVTREEVVTEMHDLWVTKDSATAQYIILGWLQTGQLERAIEMYDDLRAKRTYLQNSTYLEMIKALGRVHEVDEAIRIGKDMIEARGMTQVPPGLWYELLRIASESYNLEHTIWVWQKAVQFPIKPLYNPDDGICLNILNTAARHGSPQLATEVFRIMQSRKSPIQEHHYAALISAYALASDLPNAFRTLNTMRDQNITPSSTTANAITDAILSPSSTSNGVEQTDNVDSAYFVLKDMVEQSHEKVDIAAFNAVLNACVQLGDLDRAFGLHHDSATLNVQPDTTTYNILLSGCNSCSNPPDKNVANFLYTEMKEAGLKADKDTYEELIKVNLYQEDYWDAFMHLEEMKADTGRPRVRVYLWIAERMIEARDERLAILLGEMDEFGYKEEADEFRARSEVRA